MTARKVAFYGGAFNPVHIGHLTTIMYVLELTDVDQIIVAPVFKHPDGKTTESFEDRYEMLGRALARQPAGVVLSDIERFNWEQGGNGYTINSLKILLSRGHEKVVLVLGDDIKAAFPKWEGHDDIQALIAANKVEIFWMPRSAHGPSSTLARMCFKHNLSTKNYIQPSVREYVLEKGLYK
jgi:nicotinate-nucleotide adenylyltransferase